MISSKKIRTVGSNVIAITLAVLLVLMLAPMGSMQSAQALTGDHAISDEEIDFLLASGDYVPGEAIVVVDETVNAGESTLRSLNTDLVSSAENLMSISGDEYDQTVETATISSDSIGTLALEQNTETEDTISIRHITNTGLSTEELLYQLRDDPRVLAVEPNYISTCDDQEQEDSSITTLDASNVLPSSQIRNLTNYQWGNSNTNKAAYSASKALGFAVNPTDWDASRTTSGAENATGTIAIIDTGIDHDHPDLNGVVRNDMKNFVSWGGDHGYCPWSADPGDTMDVQHHGTHCAGIVASAWNGFGTSGVASGVKLVAVKASFDNGAIEVVNAIKGYDYLAEAVENGLDLKAINNSWGAFGSGRALSLAVTKLGNLGAISVFVSGNDGQNIDNRVYITSNLVTNPYAVVVDSADMKATLAHNSNYGAQTTNIVTSGVDILSTYPLSMAQYLPDAAMSENIKYENFINGVSDFKFYATDPYPLLTDPIIGSQSDAAYHGDDNIYSWGVKISDMSDAFSEDGTAVKRLCIRVSLPSFNHDELKHIGLYAHVQSSKTLDVGYEMSILGQDDQSATGLISVYSEGRTNAWKPCWLDIEKKGSPKGLKPLWRNKYLTIMIDISTFDDTLDPNDMIYVDDIGLGKKGALVPYAYSSGTSMAAPAATGAAAVLAEMYAASDAGLTAPERAKLCAARLEGSVQDTIGDFGSICTSGGALDLNVAKNGQYNPVLREATVAQVQGSTEITLSGYFFGATEGTVLIGGEVATVKAGSWSDNEVTVVCPASVSSGLVEILLTSNLPKTGKMTRLLELPSSPVSITPLYEKEYTLPIDQGFSNTFEEVPLLGLGGFLYAISCGDSAGIAFWKLDTDTGNWTKCPATPGAMQTCSATTYDGEIYATGYNATGTATVLYSYNPVTNAWTDHRTDKIPAFTTLVNCNEKLVAVGGADITGAIESDAVSVYDPATDTLTQVATLTKPVSELRVAVHGSKILATAKKVSAGGFGIDLIDIDTGTVQDLTNTLPSFSTERDNYCSLASVEQGFVLCGASAIADASTATFDDQDTYLLDITKLDAGAKFEALDKRASRSQLFSVSSTSHRDMLYTFGASYFEEEGYALRATNIKTLAQPGDLYSITYNNVNANEHNNSAWYSPTSLPFALNKAQNRSNESFVGWFTNPDFSGAPITELSATMTGDVELWAQWSTDGGASDNGKQLPKTGDSLPMMLMAFAVMSLLVCVGSLNFARGRK